MCFKAYKYHAFSYGEKLPSGLQVFFFLEKEKMSQKGQIPD